MEAWDTIVIGDGPAALRAAASAAKAGASTLLVSANSLGTPDTVALDGIAAPLKESTTKSHRDDTIRAGAFLCDQDIVSTRISQAIRQVDLLERWGVIFRRDSDGIPLVRRAAGHSLPRLSGAGDAMVRETQQVLEEQCMKHGVTRRGDQIPLQLVHTDQSVNGIISLDMTTGQVNALQAKTVIIADGGYEGAWNGSPIGLGLDLAMKANIPVRNMEFITWTPLAVPGTNVVLPMGMLADGATILNLDGSPIDAEEYSDQNALAQAIMMSDTIVLDARKLDTSSEWWAQTSELISTRLGINMKKQTIPIKPQVSTTLGGIVTDEHGRAIVEKWSRWFTGLYAAGDAACSGVHGAGMITGNRLLDALSGGAAAGEHAAGFAEKTSYSGISELETQLGAVEADLDIDLAATEEGTVQRAGPLLTKLKTIMNSQVNYLRDASGLESAISLLEELETEAENLYVDDKNRLYNTNLLDTLRLKAGIRLAIATAKSALARTESRGTHQRNDFAETDDSQLHHTLVDNNGKISTLAVRKGTSGSWTLPPNS
ncbi:MAG: FAD-binding protein [Candidatus Poseidoniaceae archaeon]|jgi:succinate dehydrogenase/fumarate reductase flavoprotein subunit|nr:FAD-binding protein [Candidatus Poseidoniaceae archaeon]